jgi:exoribonuclease R
MTTQIRGSDIVIVQTVRHIGANGVAVNAIPTQHEIDESFFTAVFDKAEQWLKTNQPSEAFRRVLLRTSQTAFAGWGDGVNGD